MRTADLSLEEARKEVAKFGRTTSKMAKILQLQLTERKEDKQIRQFERVRKFEEITDRMEEEISNYLVKVGEGRLTESASIRMRSILSISNDLETAADRFYQISEQINRKARKNIDFTSAQHNQLGQMFKLVDEALEIMLENLNMEYSKVSLDDAFEKEMEINTLRNRMRKAHLKSIEKKEYDLKSGISYNEIFLLLERAANHVLNVTRAITGEVGKDDEDEVMSQAAMNR
jgi:phosphate:Na+ symporter